MGWTTRYRLSTGWGTSLGLHVVALGAATYFGVPTMVWKAEVNRGYSATIVLSASATQSNESLETDFTVDPAEEAEPIVEDMANPEDMATPETLADPISIEVKPLERATVPEPDDPLVAELFTPLVSPRPVEHDPAMPEVEPIRRVERKKKPMAMALASTPSPATASAPIGADVDSPPSKLPKNPAPIYPEEARRSGVTGRVVLDVSIGADGSVARVRIHAPSGHDALDRAAIECVQGWRFSPALSNGKPVASDILVPIRFSLRSS